MSEIELHTGFLIEVNTRGLTVEEWIKRWVDNHLDTNKCSYYSDHRDDPDFNYTDTFYDLTYYNPYIITRNKIFKVYDHLQESDFICSVNKNANGDYSYVTQFYNGGTCLTEVLENGLKNIEK